ncbi:MAG: transporter [Sandaracinaceae bacterium]
MRMRFHCVFATCLTLLPAWASAQDSGGELPATFTSDRPGFANTTGIAAQGRLSTELGVSAAFGDTPEASLPLLSMRFGVFHWLEARVRGPNAVGRFPDTGDRYGVDDPSIGFKIGGQLHDTLAVSSVWEVSLPLGTDGFGSREAGWFADLNIDWSFWGPLTLTPNAVAHVRVTVDETTGETVRYFEGGGSLKFTWQLLDVLGAFVQGYAIASERADIAIQVGGGLMWMVAPNVQVDAQFNAGVTDASEPPTAGMGTTILW